MELQYVSGLRCGWWEMEKVRFNQLRREVEGITTISLTRGLDVLIENQLVEKYDFETMPLHTEYGLTEKGKSLMPILKDLNQWGKEWLQ